MEKVLKILNDIPKPLVWLCYGALGWCALVVFFGVLFLALQVANILVGIAPW